MSKFTKANKQERWVIAGALLTISLSVVTTLWFSGFFSGGPKAPSYVNVTFTDALIACQQEARQRFAGRITELVTDDHSSRYSHNDRAFKIFFVARMAADRDEPRPGDYYIGCHVHSEKGYVSSFDAHEQKETESDVIRKEKQNLFGWPIHK